MLFFNCIVAHFRCRTTMSTHAAVYVSLHDCLSSHHHLHNTAAHGFSLKSVGADWNNNDSTTTTTDGLSARESISTRGSMDRSSIEGGGVSSDELVQVRQAGRQRAMASKHRKSTSLNYTLLFSFTRGLPRASISSHLIFPPHPIPT